MEEEKEEKVRMWVRQRKGSLEMGKEKEGEGSFQRWEGKRMGRLGDERGKGKGD